MGSDQRNIILAVALSLGVIGIWQYFVVQPELDRQRELAIQEETIETRGQTPSTSPLAEGVPVISSENTERFISREEVLAGSKSNRIRVDNPNLDGSINLEGARFDDLSLKKYHETVDRSSPEIVLFSPKGSDQAYYTSFGWLSAKTGIRIPDDKTLWQADHDTLTSEQPVTLQWDNGEGIIFKRKISLDDKAMFTIEDSIDNQTDQDLPFYAYGLISRLIPEKSGTSYAILHEGALGVLGEAGLQEFTLSKLKDEKPVAARGKGVLGHSWENVQGGFIGITEKYWASAIIPDQTISYNAVFSVRSSNDRDSVQTDIRSPELIAPAGGSIQFTQRLFAGAKEVSVVDGYHKTYNILYFDRMIDWGWFNYITKPLFSVLNYFHKLLGNFGLSILLVTVLLKLIFLPLANKSYTSMAKMKAIQPEMNALRERYKDNPQEQQKALMALYKSKKINPVAGCWPLFLQIPVFFALYKVLFITIEMRHSPFFGWIQDLAAPDPTSLWNIFGLLPYDPALLPVIGGFLDEYARLGIWPILMGITMWLQMKMNPEPTDPVQKQIFSWMPIMFTFMLGSFAAGLVIYWTWNNFLSIIQQGIIMKRNGAKIELWGNLLSTFKKDNKTEPPAASK